MAAGNPEGLGGRRWVVKKEIHPLPNSRQEILSLISNILNAGGVKKLVIEQGQPVRIQRWVEPDGPDVPLPETAPLLERAMAGQVESITPADHLNCYERLFHAFALASRSGFNVTGIVVKSESLLVSWLELDVGATSFDKVYGVPVVVDFEMPEDSILVVASNEDGDAFCSVRIPMPP